MKLITWREFKRSVTRSVDAEECYAVQQQSPPRAAVHNGAPLTGAGVICPKRVGGAKEHNDCGGVQFSMDGVREGRRLTTLLPFSVFLSRSLLAGNGEKRLADFPSNHHQIGNILSI